MIKQFNMVKYLEAVNKLISSYLDDSHPEFTIYELMMSWQQLNDDIIKDLKK